MTKLLHFRRLLYRPIHHHHTQTRRGLETVYNPRPQKLIYTKRERGGRRESEWRQRQPPPPLNKSLLISFFLFKPLAYNVAR
jgi:hypothetical protein